MLELEWSGSCNVSYNFRAQQHCETVTEFAAKLLHCKCDDNLRKRARVWSLLVLYCTTSANISQKLFSNLHSSWKKEGLFVEQGGVLMFFGVWDAASSKVVLDKSRLPRAASRHQFQQQIRDGLDELCKLENPSDADVVEASDTCLAFLKAINCQRMRGGSGAATSA